MDLFPYVAYASVPPIALAAASPNHRLTTEMQTGMSVGCLHVEVTTDKYSYSAHVEGDTYVAITQNEDPHSVLCRRRPLEANDAPFSDLTQRSRYAPYVKEGSLPSDLKNEMFKNSCQENFFDDKRGYSYDSEDAEYSNMDSILSEQDPLGPHPPTGLVRRVTFQGSDALDQAFPIQFYYSSWWLTNTRDALPLSLDCHLLTSVSGWRLNDELARQLRPVLSQVYFQPSVRHLRQPAFRALNEEELVWWRKTTQGTQKMFQAYAKVEVGLLSSSLRFLNLFNCPFAAGDAELECLHALEEICLSRMAVVTLDFLRKNHNLKKIFVSDLHALRHLFTEPCECDALVEVDITDASNLISLHGLETLTKLKTVVLSYCTALKDGRPLLECGSLETIALKGTPITKWLNHPSQAERMKACASLRALKGVLESSDLLQLLPSCTQLKDLEVLPSREGGGDVIPVDIPAVDTLRRLKLTSIENASLLMLAKKAYATLDSLLLEDVSGVFDKVVSHRSNVRELYVMDTELHFTPDHPPPGQVERLTLIDVRNGRDLSFLESFTHLKRLNLSETRLPSLSFLRSIPLLEELLLNQVRGPIDCGPIGSLAHLRALEMRQTKVDNAGFTAITACGALETLDLSLCDNLQEITAVGPLQRLRVVHLSSCLGLRLVDGLADCPALELVNLSYCPRLTRVLPLLAHPTLHTLLCRETSAKLPPYQELLHRARYYFTHPQDPLLSPIVSKLQWVDFSACRSLGEISVLSLLPNLRYLNLRGTSITRLCHPDLFDHFDGLSLTYLLYPSLVRMDVSACRALHDLSALAWSERLREVNMDDCVEVLEFSVLLTCPSLNLVTAARCQSPNVSLPTVINSGSTLQQRLLRTKHHSGRLIFSTSVSTV